MININNISETNENMDLIMDKIEPKTLETFNDIPASKKKTNNNTTNEY